MVICSTTQCEGTFKRSSGEERDGREEGKRNNTLEAATKQQQGNQVAHQGATEYLIWPLQRVTGKNLEMSNVQLSNSALERLVARRTFPLHKRTSVCRNLFGPVDHDELSREMKSKLREISERDQQRWNFDFESNRPLDGDYKWEEVPVDNTPVFYMDSVQVDRTRVPATPVKQMPSPDSAAPETPLMDVQERLAMPESSNPVSPTEVNQENRSDKLNSGKSTHKLAPCVRRKRAASTDNAHITGK